MAFLLERVRDALAPHYEVERQLGAGGMGVVFLARDTRLDRRVAIKVLRPDQATAVAGERFSREARVLARLRHPNIVRVYLADDTGGLSYYVMEYLEGDTLKSRLENGPLPARAVRALGRELLDALAAAHRQDIVHRDVKPDNIILIRERTILTDFGIAHTEDGATTITEPGQQIGTRRYMPPEQLAGLEVTPRSDLYATASVLYEACTGRRWSQSTSPDKGDWAGVPRSLAAALRRGLALRPADRWATAAAFRAALDDRPRRVVMLAGGALGALLLALFIREVTGGDDTGGELVAVHKPTLSVVPFADAADGAVGRQLARHVATQLEWFARWDFVWRDSVSAARTSEAGGRPAARLRAEGDLLTRGGDTVLQLVVRDGEELKHVVKVPGSSGDMLGWGRDIADSMVRRTFPQYVDEFRHYARKTSRNVPAHEALHAGQDAFRRDTWADAELAFNHALELDPRFAQAAWNLALIRKWRRDSSHVLILRRLYEAQRDDLPPLQRLLTEAELQPDIQRRIATFAEAVRRFPLSTDALLLLGNELYHRGPLVGIPLDSGIAVLEATAAREAFSTARVHAALGHIRLGHQQQARRDLDLLPPADQDADGEARMRDELLRFAYDERFRPLIGRVKRTLLPYQADAGLVDGLHRFARLANFFDLPETQLALGSLLATQAADTRVRGSGVEAQGLALLLLGRSAEALPRLDSAAKLLRSEEAAFQALEWRVLLPLLGLPAPGADELARARGRLAAAAEPFSARASWALASEAAHRGDTAAARSWAAALAARIGTDPRTALLLPLLEAFGAARSSPDSALALTAPLLHYEPAGLGADPFARAILYLQRAEWQRARGDPAAADRTLRFVEAWDTHEWPQREAQQGEVDVVVGAVARLRRAELASAAGRGDVACALALRVAQLWSRADPEYAPLRRRADTIATRCA
jgi:serine/threonine protein kinase